MADAMPEQKDEGFGGVGEAEARGDPQRPPVPGDVGDEDDEHRDAAEEVEAWVAHPLRG